MSESVVAKHVSDATPRPDAVWMTMPSAKTMTPVAYIAKRSTVRRQSMCPSMVTSRGLIR